MLPGKDRGGLQFELQGAEPSFQNQAVDLYAGKADIAELIAIGAPGGRAAGRDPGGAIDMQMGILRQVPMRGFRASALVALAVFGLIIGRTAFGYVPPPFTLNGSSPSASEVDLSWSGAPSGTTSYNVQQYGGGSWNNIQSNYGPVSYNYTSATPGSTNRFRIIANPSGSSSNSIDVVTRPSAPTLAVATPNPFGDAD